ncbi:MAG: UDP-N-acetylmuramoyl-tripeptide--D-alanyl-D-alanine ligase, partial [Desulfovibrio sp.]|nr:UDP-N-acetylmuramoyl-tripeptide--D-alanyl-D-alanine ligase [Desulfovibrio sp.]
DMDALAAMLEPDVVVAVNVGAAHLEGLQDVATVAREKCKLIEAMRPEGLAVASADCPELQHAVGQTGRQAVWFGTDPATAAEYQCEFISLTETGGRFGLTLRGERLEVDTAFAAPFLAQSLAAAAAAAHVLGAPAGMIAQRLTTARLPEQRFQVQRAGRWIIIDDSYNANPLSMAAVLQAARLMAGSDGSLALVLGEMRELGDAARDAHVTLGVQVAHLAPAAVFWAGGQGDAVAAGLARAGGAMAVRGLGAPDRFMQELADVFGTEGDDVVVVFKGSRANRLERFVTALRDAAQGAC